MKGQKKVNRKSLKVSIILANDESSFSRLWYYIRIQSLFSLSSKVL